MGEISDGESLENAQIHTLLLLNNKFEDILNAHDPSNGHFALPQRSARELRECFMQFACLYEQLSDNFRASKRKAFNSTEKQPWQSIWQNMFTSFEN